jgi:hypothetical protein
MRDELVLFVSVEHIMGLTDVADAVRFRIQKSHAIKIRRCTDNRNTYLFSKAVLHHQKKS